MSSKIKQNPSEQLQYTNAGNMECRMRGFMMYISRFECLTGDLQLPGGFFFALSFFPPKLRMLRVNASALLK